MYTFTYTLSTDFLPAVSTCLYYKRTKRKKTTAATEVVDANQGI